MINNPKETEFPPREEGNSSEIGKATPKASSSASSAYPVPWLGLKDPRIVRMSRVFGGKDRHSKVCTVRGLKDRRVRLSVPTAIQLYDLQDRLGLNQPSKVVDWLLNAAKHDIDELPPLPIPLAGNFSLLTPREANVAAAAATTASQSNNEDQGVVLRNNNDNEMNAIEWELGARSRPNFWTSTTTTRTTSSDALWRARSKEVTRDNNERKNWRGNTATATTNEVEKGGGNEGSNNILPQRTNNHPFFPGMLNNIAHVPNIANYRWELPNYPLLSHLGGNHGFNVTSQTDHIQHLQSLNVMSLQPSNLSLSTGSPFMLCPPGIASTSTTTQTYFPSQSSAANSVEIVDPRQVNHHFQMLSSNAAAQNLLPNPMMRPLHFGMNNSKQLVGFSPNDNIGSDQQQNKEQE